MAQVLQALSRWFGLLDHGAKYLVVRDMGGFEGDRVMANFAVRSEAEHFAMSKSLVGEAMHIAEITTTYIRGKRF